MKKIKLDPNKIIKIPPRMENDGPDVNLLLVIIIGIALGLFLISCNEQSKVKEKPIGLRQQSDDRYKNVTEFTYGGCQYIKVGYGDCAWGSHKGNCKNPIHKK
jgi:hypothetical protein